MGATEVLVQVPIWKCKFCGRRWLPRAQTIPKSAPDDYVPLVPEPVSCPSCRRNDP